MTQTHEPRHEPPVQPSEDEGRRPLRRALISVYDKTGLEELARGLADAGVALVSTGSTAARIADAVDRTMPALGGGPVARMVCHPGGAKVITALEDALALPAGSLDAEREVLREAGNMSAPTVLFVLKKVLEAGATGRLMLAALGPGFTLSMLPVDV